MTRKYATAIKKVHDKDGTPLKIRALLDSGSQINIMTEKMYRKIGIQSQATSMRIRGIENASVESNKRAYSWETSHYMPTINEN